MKKRLIALILLFGLIGCDKSPPPITTQTEQNKERPPESPDNHRIVDAKTTTDYLSSVLGNDSVGTIPEITKDPNETPAPQEFKEPDEIVKPEETLAPTLITYISRNDGFSVLMPTTPTLMHLDPTNSIHLRLYQTKVQDGLVQYNIFCHFFDKKMLSNEIIRSYLDSYLPDRLVGFDKGQIIRKTLTKFRGFDAKEFEYRAAQGDAEFIYQGVAFLIDGDSISLTMVYPKETPPELTFDEFTESFELLPLEPLLSPEHWIDERLRLRFTPPADMSKLNQGTGRNGLIVMFASETDHTIGILDATIAYPGITGSEIQSQLSKMKDCGDGFYENIIPGTTTKSPMVQLLRCVNTGEKIYLIQAYAPQKTYFRSAPTFKAAMKSFSFGN